MDERKMDVSGTVACLDPDCTDPDHTKTDVSQIGVACLDPDCPDPDHA